MSIVCYYSSMELTHTVGMVDWKLKGTMDSHGISRYELQKKSGVAMNTLRAMYDGSTRRPDLEVLDKVIKTMNQITGKTFNLSDILEWRE